MGGFQTDAGGEHYLADELAQWHDAMGRGDQSAVQRLQQEAAGLLQQEFDRTGGDPQRVEAMRRTINNYLDSGYRGQTPIEVLNSEHGLSIIDRRFHRRFIVNFGAAPAQRYRTQSYNGQRVQEFRQRRDRQREMPGPSYAPPAEEATQPRRPLPEGGGGVDSRSEPQLRRNQPVPRGDQGSAARAEFQTVSNPDGTQSHLYRDGSRVAFDRSRPPRVTEVVQANGERTRFSYKGNSESPTGFEVIDRAGKVVETGERNPHKAEWLIKFHKEGRTWTDKTSHIAELRVRQDGMFDLVDRQGIHHEHDRNGDHLRRDHSGRILAEQTPNGLFTEYAYSQGDGQPSSFTVRDKIGGHILEHGVLSSGTWRVYRKGAGESGLNPANLEDPTRMEHDPIDRVVGLQLDQRTGRRVDTHANGDQTWQSLYGDRLFRRTKGGSLIVVGHTDSGQAQLLYARDRSGFKTIYRYDRNDDLLQEIEESPDGRRRVFTRKGEDTWQDQQGHTMRRTVEQVTDGSVVATYPDKKLVLVQNSDGSELVKQLGQDGQTRIIHTTDSWGRDTQFSYAGGDLVSIEVTDPDGRKVSWTRTRDAQGQLVPEMWVNDSGRQFRGTATVNPDGSVTWLNKKTGRRFQVTRRGVTMAVVDK